MDFLITQTLRAPTMHSEQIKNNSDFRSQVKEVLFGCNKTVYFLSIFAEWIPASTEHTGCDYPKRDGIVLSH